MKKSFLELRAVDQIPVKHKEICLIIKGRYGFQKYSALKLFKKQIRKYSFHKDIEEQSNVRKLIFTDSSFALSCDTSFSFISSILVLVVFGNSEISDASKNSIRDFVTSFRKLLNLSPYNFE